MNKFNSLSKFFISQNCFKKYIFFLSFSIHLQLFSFSITEYWARLIFSAREFNHFMEIKLDAQKNEFLSLSKLFFSLKIFFLCQTIEEEEIHGTKTLFAHNGLIYIQTYTSKGKFNRRIDKKLNLKKNIQKVFFIVFVFFIKLVSESWSTIVKRGSRIKLWCKIEMKCKISRYLIKKLECILK